MAICDCTTFAGNTGIPSCVEIINSARTIIFAPKFKSNGERFSIPANTTISQAYLDSLINAENPNDRIYPITGNLKNITDVRGENITEDFDDQTSSFIAEGARTFEAFIIGTNAPPKLQAKVNAIQCGEYGAYIIDKSGNWTGTASKDCSVLYPTLIEQGTFHAGFVKATNTEKSKLRLNFQWDLTELDSNLNMFKASSITADLSSLKGLLDVTVTEVVAPSTTALTVDMSYLYGELFGGKQKYKGLVAADVVLFNKTQNDIVTLTSLTETLDGRYVFDYTGDAQTVADVLQIQSKATLGVLDTTGYEITKVDLTPVA